MSPWSWPAKLGKTRRGGPGGARSSPPGPINSPVTLFEARRLHKRFGDHVVLEEITLAFEAGRLSGIMGPNGAGKTTCFNVLTGRYKPDRGRVIFDGEDITGLPPRAIARKGISRSFQLMSVFDEYTALENVRLALPEVRARGFDMLHDLDRDTATVDRAAAVLARVGLAGRERAPARGLSYGDRRALEIGIALAAEPRMLFLDEPTSGLGTEATARLADLVRELRRSLTLVVIEHDMRFLFGLADRIAVIHWGQVIAQGTPDELRADPWVRASILGPGHADPAGAAGA
jgi:branched-chain amino acid transport system ATP-binding protein